MRVIQIFSFAFVLSSLGAVAQSADWKIIQELIAKRNYSLAQLHLNALKVDNLTPANRRKTV